MRRCKLISRARSDQAGEGFVHSWQKIIMSDVAIRVENLGKMYPSTTNLRFAGFD
jgi:hypothetical protein